MNEISLISKENNVYSYLQKCILEKHKDSVSTIAKRCGVASSTVVKVCKKCGFSGWNDMFYTFEKMHNSNISVAFNEFNHLNISDIQDRLDILSTVFKQYKNDFIIIEAIGFSEFIAEWLSTELTIRGYRVFLKNTLPNYVENNRLQIAGLCIFVTEGGLVYYGMSNQYKEKGITIVSVTSSDFSPLAMNSHISIEIKNNKSAIDQYEPNYFTARVIIFFKLLLSILDKNR